MVYTKSVCIYIYTYIILVNYIKEQLSKAGYVLLYNMPEEKHIEGVSRSVCLLFFHQRTNEE